MGGGSGMGPASGTLGLSMPVFEVKEVIWEDTSFLLRLTGWSGHFLCGRFEHREYQTMINWCIETFPRKCKFSYTKIHAEMPLSGIHYNLKTREIKWFKYTKRKWIKIKNVKSIESFAFITGTLKICFKNKKDAALFRMTFGE